MVSGILQETHKSRVAYSECLHAVVTKMESLFLGLEEEALEEDQTGEGNYSMTCAARSLRDASNISFPASLAAVLKVSQVIFFFVFAVSGIILNGLVAVLVMSSRKLRNRSFAIAVQIVLANLGVIIFSTIPSIIQIGLGEPVFGMGQCVFSGYLLHCFVDVRVLLVLAFSLDRFASVFAPFLYPRHNLALTVAMSVLSWFFGAAFNLIGIPQILDCYIYSKPITACFLSMICNSSCQIFRLLYVSVIIFPAVVASLVFIIALFVKGRKIRQQTSQMTGTLENRMTESDWKAVKTFLLLIVTIVALQLGIAVTLALYHINNVAVHSPLMLLAAFVVVYFIVDPIVILRNADARKELKAMTKRLTGRL